MGIRRRKVKLHEFYVSDMLKKFSHLDCLIGCSLPEIVVSSSERKLDREKSLMYIAKKKKLNFKHNIIFLISYLVYIFFPTIIFFLISCIYSVLNLFSFFYIQYIFYNASCNNYILYFIYFNNNDVFMIFGYSHSMICFVFFFISFSFNLEFYFI